MKYLLSTDILYVYFNCLSKMVDDFLFFRTAWVGGGGGGDGDLFLVNEMLKILRLFKKKLFQNYLLAFFVSGDDVVEEVFVLDESDATSTSESLFSSSELFESDVL